MFRAITQRTPTSRPSRYHQSFVDTHIDINQNTSSTSVISLDAALEPPSET